MSIRTRFLAVISVIMLATIGTLLICGYLLTSRFLLREVDQNLDNRVQIVSELLQSRPRLRGGSRMRNPITDVLLPTRFDAITQVISADGDILIFQFLKMRFESQTTIEANEIGRQLKSMARNTACSLFRFEAVAHCRLQ
jgi:hypothetical protein